MDLNKTKGATKSMNNSNEGQTKQTNPVCLNELICPKCGDVMIKYNGTWSCQNWSCWYHFKENEHPKVKS